MCAIDIWQEIWRHHTEFEAAIKLRKSYSFQNDLHDKFLVRQWLDGQSQFTPSWLNLLNAMRSSGLKKLSFVIERFLYTVPPTASLPLAVGTERKRTEKEILGREQGELRLRLF